MRAYLAWMAIACLAVAAIGCGTASTPESGPGPGPDGELRSFDSGASSTEAKPLDKPQK